MLISHIKCVVVITFASDGSGDVVKVVLLSGSIVWSLDHMSVGDKIHVSSTLHLSLDMEWSVDVHSPNFAESRFLNGSIWSIKIENIPLLVEFIVSVLPYNLSTLVIKFALNAKNLFFLILNDTIIIFEKLVPS
jgi:hypothetical protein